MIGSGGSSEWGREYEDEDTWYEFSSAYQSGPDTYLIPSSDTGMSLRMAEYRRTGPEKAPKKRPQRFRPSMKERRDLRDLEKEEEEEAGSSRAMRHHKHGLHQLRHLAQSERTASDQGRVWVPPHVHGPHPPCVSTVTCSCHRETNTHSRNTNDLLPAVRIKQLETNCVSMTLVETGITRSPAAEMTLALHFTEEPFSRNLFAPPPEDAVLLENNNLDLDKDMAEDAGSDANDNQLKSDSADLPLLSGYEVVDDDDDELLPLPGSEPILPPDDAVFGDLIPGDKPDIPVVSVTDTDGTVKAISEKVKPAKKMPKLARLTDKVMAQRRANLDALDIPANGDNSLRRASVGDQAWKRRRDNRRLSSPGSIPEDEQLSMKASLKQYIKLEAERKLNALLGPMQTGSQAYITAFSIGLAMGSILAIIIKCILISVKFVFA